jgi:hypothetical protein
MSDDLSNLPTNRLPPAPESKPVDENNIDWSGEVTDARLERVPRIYSQDTIIRKLYSEDSHILNIHTGELNVEPKIELNKLRAKLVSYINDLLNDSTHARSVLISDYDFKTVTGLHAITPQDFDLLKARSLDKYPQVLKRYQQERLVLVQALEQALALISSNQILMNLVSSYLLYNGRVPDEMLPEFHGQVFDAGLNIWITNTTKGFNNDPGNHGTLVYINGGIRLNLDEMGRSSLRELIHEYAAYLIITTSAENKNRKISSQEELDNAKQVDLMYIMLLIDLLVSGVTHTRRYTNLAGMDLP